MPVPLDKTKALLESGLVSMMVPSAA